MSSTEKNERLIHLAGYASIALIIYISLVALDLFSDIYLQNVNGRKASQLEQDRACDEDYQQVDEARKLGYHSLLFPDLYDHPPYKLLAEKYQIAPLASTPNTNLYYCNEGYGQVRYKSDRYGFRNTDSLWDLPVVDAILIGDSFVQGACVNADANISGHLRSMGITSLNLGTGSNSPIHYAAIAQTFLKIKKPANAVVIFYPNDNIENERNSIFNKLYFNQPAEYFNSRNPAQKVPELAPNLKTLYRDSEALLAASDHDIDEQRLSAIRQCSESRKTSTKVYTSIDAAKTHLTLKNLRGLIKGYLSTTLLVQKELPYGSKLTIDVLQAECKQNMCNPLIVYIPNSSFWRPDARAKQYSNLLKEYAEQRGIMFLDTTPQISKMGISAYARRGPHLSPEGYQVVATMIADAIKRPTHPN